MDDLDYFSDANAREEELRRINEELDSKLDKVSKLEPYTAAEGGEILLGGGEDESNNWDELNEHNVDEFFNLKDLLVVNNDSNHRCVADSAIDERNLNTNNQVNIRGASKLSSKKVKKKKNGLKDQEGRYADATTTPDEEDPSYLIQLDDLSYHSSNDNHQTPCYSTKTKNGSSKNGGKEQQRQPQQQHFQMVQIKALSEQLKIAIESKSQLSKTNVNLKFKLSQTQESNRKLQSQVSKLQSTMNKAQNENKSNQNHRDDLSIENASLKKEVSGFKSIIQDYEMKSRKNESKMKRCIESIEKFKSMVEDYKTTKSENDELFHSEKQGFVTKIKALTKQRDDLVVGYKKQSQLIHVLKQMKVHLEASRLLDFTEQEFMNVLDWGPSHIPNKAKRTK